MLWHARTTRLVASCVLFTVSLLTLPRADIPETPFDEANTPTNEMLVEKAGPLQEYREATVAVLPKTLVSSRNISPLPVHAPRSTGSLQLQELLFTLRC